MKLIAEAEIVLSDNAVAKPNEVLEVGKHVSPETAKMLVDNRYARVLADEPKVADAPKPAKGKKGGDEL